MHRFLPDVANCSVRVVMVVAALLTVWPSSSAPAEEEAERIVGESLVILRDGENVTVTQRDRLLLRYRYANIPKKPYVAELTSPSGRNILRDAPADHLHHHGLMFAWTVDGVDFWSEPPVLTRNDQCGGQIHEEFSRLAIDTVDGTERAVIEELVLWETPDGDIILEERRTLTVPAVDEGEPRLLIWQADFTPGEDAIDTLTIDGAKYHGLGMRFVEPMDTDGVHFNSVGGRGVTGTNGKKASWSAYAAPIDSDQKVTVAMFDAPTNPRHPTEWFTMGGPPSFAYLSATVDVGTRPLKVEFGKTLSVRFGVAVFDGEVDRGRVDSAYTQWYRLQAAARSGTTPGLIGKYFAGDSQEEPTCCRIDPTIAFDWSDGMPDDRLPAGPFSVTWDGQVRVDRDGEYRFSFDRPTAEGRIRVDDQLVYAAEEASDDRSIELEFGYHPIRVEYVASSGLPKSVVRLVWDSEHFAPEVINPRHLVHDASDESPIAMELLHESGRIVVERYGCARCHETPGVEPGRRPGPPLAFSADIKGKYLAEWIGDPQSLRPGTPMPGMAGSPEQIDAAMPAMVAYLQSLSPPASDITPVAAASGEELIADGRLRFRQLGCGACHAPEAPDQVDPAVAPSLADVGAKWSTASLQQFLAEPTRRHPEGGMPDFALIEIDLQRLAAYLSTFDDGKDPTADKGDKGRQSSAELIAQGKQLIEQHACAACHEIGGIEFPATGNSAPDLGKAANVASGCLSTGRSAGAAPRFVLPVADRVAVEEFLARRPEAPSAVAPGRIAGRAMQHTYACFRCHVRDGNGGDALGRAVLRYSSEEKGFDQLPLMPPEISGVGARLQREWLLKVLEGNAPSPRPWLKVRMPAFAINAEQRELLADHLTAADRIPDLKAPRPHKLPVAMTATAGRLLGGAGFSCVNCHYIGKTPSEGETSAPDLTMMTRRVGRDWFHRWLANPARIIPTTPMPAFNVPATNIAGEDLLVQKETVWQFLKHTPAASIKKMLAEGTTAVQVAGLRPLVVQGRVLGYAGVTRGVAIGFSNGRSLLFDNDRMAWRAAWKGGFLNEAGRHGADHYWEPAGTQTWLSHDNSPPILFREKATGRWIGPALWRNRFGFLDRVTLIGRAVQLDYRLRAPGPRTGTHEPDAWVRVTELVEPNPAATDSKGTLRTIRVTGVPEAYDVVIQQSFGGIVGSDLDFAKGEPTIAAHPTIVAGDDGNPRWVTRVDAPEPARWIAPPESIEYPVEQPFTDELPMDPASRFDPVVEPAEGRLAVLISNQGEPIEVTWQTTEHAAGSSVAVGPPVRWPEPPANPVLQDPKRAIYVGYPVAIEELQQSRPLVVPPGFKVERLPLEEEFLPCALIFYRGKLLIGGYDGEMRFVDDTDGDGLQDSYRYFGGLLQQVNNLRVYDDRLYATSPGAVYRISDTNDDEVADVYESLSSLWDWSGHRNDWFFGLTRDKQGNLYGANSTPFIYRPGGKPPGYYLRGDVLRITPEGRTEKVGTGTRFQFGWADHESGRMYFNINQGHYNYTCGIHEVIEGAHYGFLEPDLSKVQWPVVRTPYPWCKSLNGMDFADSDVPFGPFQGQGFSADYNTNQVIRWADYAVGEKRQGTCYNFFTGTDAGPTEIVFGPDGAMYVGFMCDQGWYGGRARGGIYKISYVGPRTFAVLEARAVKDGFTIELTDQVDPATVSLDICPKVHRWWHENKGTYASPEIDHEEVPVQEISVSADGKILHLKTDKHVTPRLYRIELKGLKSKEGRELVDGLIY
ncbi:MAG: DUF6807 family protein, partial [Thermoguttaceae bacterium]